MPKWLEWAQQLQAIAQAGLTFSKDMYDIERFQQIRDLSVEIMSEYTDTPMEKVTELFASESGYQTPKIDVRGAVFREGKILMVKEKLDGLWAMPGGFADIGLSLSESVAKEVHEEAGFQVKPVKLLAVLDRSRHPHPPHPNYIIKVHFLCEIESGEAAEGLETSGVGFFGLDELPPLSVDRNTEQQIRLMFEYLENPSKEPVFD